ncbi:uncharacterized protein EI97DRAFT_473825, partial [Westerdykella ornata]
LSTPSLQVPPSGQLNSSQPSKPPQSPPPGPSTVQYTVKSVPYTVVRMRPALSRNGTLDSAASCASSFRSSSVLDTYIAGNLITPAAHSAQASDNGRRFTARRHGYTTCAPPGHQNTVVHTPFDAGAGFCCATCQPVNASSPTACTGPATNGSRAHRLGPWLTRFPRMLSHSPMSLVIESYFRLLARVAPTPPAQPPPIEDPSADPASTACVPVAPARLPWVRREKS